MTADIIDLVARRAEREAEQIADKTVETYFIRQPHQFALHQFGAEMLSGRIEIMRDDLTLDAAIALLLEFSQQDRAAQARSAISQ